MSAERAKIGVGVGSWAEQFMVALRDHEGFGREFEAELFDIDRSDWIERCAPFDLIVWKSDHMGPEFSGYFKKKVFFMEHYLGKEGYARLVETAGGARILDCGSAAVASLTGLDRLFADAAHCRAPVPLGGLRRVARSPGGVRATPSSTLPPAHPACRGRVRNWPHCRQVGGAARQCLSELRGARE